MERGRARRQQRWLPDDHGIIRAFRPARGSIDADMPPPAGTPEKGERQERLFQVGAVTLLEGDV